jgi:hypothetical protein
MIRNTFICFYVDGGIIHPKKIIAHFFLRKSKAKLNFLNENIFPMKEFWGILRIQCKQGSNFAPNIIRFDHYKASISHNKNCKGKFSCK